MVCGLKTCSNTTVVKIHVSSPTVLSFPIDVIVLVIVLNRRFHAYKGQLLALQRYVDALQESYIFLLGLDVSICSKYARL